MEEVRKKEARSQGLEVKATARTQDLSWSTLNRGGA
jgi:hypothetical protein